MAPLKFEEHIKEKLEQRKLQPSSDAWQKLNEQLDSNASKRSNKSFWWLGLAASLVGVLLVVTVIFNSDNENSIQPTIVDGNAKDKVIEDNAVVNTTNEVQEENASTTIKLEDSIKQPLKQQKEETTKSPSLLKQKLVKEQTKLVPTQTEDAVVVAEQNKENLDSSKETVKALSAEELKIQTVVAQMKKLQEQRESSLDSELDALLNEAQKEIALEKLYNEAIKSVDAEALLQGVEQDLDESFRDKVFKALKESYKTVKTAVAERNN